MCCVFIALCRKAYASMCLPYGSFQTHGIYQFQPLRKMISFMNLDLFPTLFPSIRPSVDKLLELSTT